MIYDLIIIGAGPAGLTAGIYAARSGLQFVILDKMGFGGQIMTSDKVENYPGFVDEISGAELISNMYKQAKKFECEFLTKEAVVIKVIENDVKLIFTNDGKEFKTRSIIIATGAAPKKIGIPGEAKFIGKGVSFCATCDGPFFRDKSIAVIGGGNTAVEESIFLTKFASKVYIIHRRDELRAEKILRCRACLFLERTRANSKHSALPEALQIAVFPHASR